MGRLQQLDAQLADWSSINSVRHWCGFNVCSRLVQKLRFSARELVQSNPLNHINVNLRQFNRFIR